jgi:hypothetical protein
MSETYHGYLRIYRDGSIEYPAYTDSMVVDIPNDPVFRMALAEVRDGNVNAARKLSWKLFYRCIKNRYYSMLGYCEYCPLSHVCALHTSKKSIRWIMGVINDNKDYELGRNLYELAKYNPDVRHKLRESGYDNI